MTIFKPTLFKSVRYVWSDLKSPRLLMSDTTGWLPTEMAECAETKAALKETVLIYLRSATAQRDTAFVSITPSQKKGKVLFILI